jgi:hypothetical protein
MPPTVVVGTILLQRTSGLGSRLEIPIYFMFFKATKLLFYFLMLIYRCILKFLFNKFFNTNFA